MSEPGSSSMKVDGSDDMVLLRDQLDGALLLLGLVVDAIEKAKTFDEVADALETVLTDQQDGVAMAREFRLLREYMECRTAKYVGAEELDQRIKRFQQIHAEIDALRAGASNKTRGYTCGMPPAGDGKGMPYRVEYQDAESGEWKVMGWCDVENGGALMESARLWPRASGARVVPNE